MIEVITVPALSDNYVWLLADRSRRQAVVVDPGEAAPVKAALREHDVELSGILITHHHGDHTGGIDALLGQREIPVWGPAGERIPRCTTALRDGETVAIEALGITFQVLEVPGHTRGHIAYYGAGLLFCGDTLFAGGCGRLFEGTAAQMRASLNSLATLPGDTRVYAGHEYTQKNLEFAAAVQPDDTRVARRLEATREARRRGEATLPSSLRDELETNPFLRCAETAVQTSAARHAGKPLHTEDEVFAALRQWRDGF